MIQEQQKGLVSADVLAFRLGLPRAWVLAQRKAGKLPALCIGRRYLFDIEIVRDALAKRAIHACDGGEENVSRENVQTGPAEGEWGSLVFTREQVAALLQVSEDTIANLHRTGQLRGVKIGKHLRWRPADVRAFVEGLGKNQTG